MLTILREELQVSPERHKELSEEVSRKRRSEHVITVTPRELVTCIWPVKLLLCTAMPPMVSTSGMLWMHAS